MEGWKDSTGVTAERQYAAEKGMPIRFVDYPSLEVL